jgi:hypothetical protein
MKLSTLQKEMMKFQANRDKVEEGYEFFRNWRRLEKLEKFLRRTGLRFCGISDRIRDLTIRRRRFKNCGGGGSAVEAFAPASRSKNSESQASISFGSRLQVSKK